MAAASVVFRALTLLMVLVAFVFLLLIIISTPVVKSLHLAATDSFTYGLFGFCEGDKCAKANYPYTLSSVGDKTAFKLANSTRDSFAKLFVTAPIAAFFALVAFVFVIVTAFVDIPGVIAVVIVVLLFLASIVTTIGVVLAFYPHVQWLGWLSVGASAALLLAVIFMVLTLLDPENDDDDLEDMLDDDLDIGKSKSNLNLGFQPPPTSGFAAAGKGGYSVHSAQSYNDTSSSMSRTYNSNTNNNGFGATNKAAGIGNTTSNTVYSSLYNEKPQTQTDVTHLTPTLKNTVPYGMSGNQGSKQGSSVAGSNAPYPAANTNVLDDDDDGYNFNDKRYDDDELDLNNMRRNQNQADSDLDLDFTSVLQRPPNPNYSGPPGGAQNYPNTANYQPSYGFQQQQQQQQQPLMPQGQGQGYSPQVPSIQPQFYNSQPPSHNIVNSPAYASTAQQYSNYYSNNYVRHQQQQQPTISDTVLNSNPDFQLSGAAANKRRNNGFIPPSQRYNKPGMSR